MRFTGSHCCFHAESFCLVVWLASFGVFLLILFCFGGEVARAEGRSEETGRVGMGIHDEKFTKNQ